MSQPVADVHSSRRYKIALAGAVLLFMATLTLTIVVALIASARQQDREAELEMTLTAAFAGLNQTEMARAVSPTPAPILTYGRFPFALRDGSPAYQAAENCDQQILGGSVLDQDGEPTDAFQALIWGDFFTTQVVSTGEVAQQAKGEWRLELSGMVNRRLWAQLIAGGRYLSAPVEIVFGAGNCDQNRVDVTFSQVAPLE
jgi:hypothetical protein